MREWNQLLIKRFPELKAEFVDYVEWQEGVDTGSHVVYGDIFEPYIKGSFDSRNESALECIYSFIEELLSTGDSYIENVVAVTLFEGNLKDFDNRMLSQDLYPRTRDLLDEMLLRDKRTEIELINEQFNTREKAWINLLISELNSSRRTVFLEQLNRCEIFREYTDYFAFIKFKINRGPKRIVTQKRVPLEMSVFFENKPPMIFLLHVINGYIEELEIFNADSSLLDYDAKLDKYEIKDFL